MSVELDWQEPELRGALPGACVVPAAAAAPAAVASAVAGFAAPTAPAVPHAMPALPPGTSLRPPAGRPPGSARLAEVRTARAPAMPRAELPGTWLILSTSSARRLMPRAAALTLSFSSRSSCRSRSRASLSAASWSSLARSSLALIFSSACSWRWQRFHCIVLNWALLRVQSAPSLPASWLWLYLTLPLGGCGGIGGPRISQTGLGGPCLGATPHPWAQLL